MAIPLITVQTSSVDANAGNQITYNQTVGLTSTTSGNGLASGTSAPGTDQAPSNTTSTTSTATPTWATWVVILALAYFGYKFLE